MSSVYGLIEQQCQLQLPWKSCSKRILFLIKCFMKDRISEGDFSQNRTSFYLLFGLIILSRLSHGGLQSWLGLHHPAVLGTPSPNGVGSIHVLIHQCQAKPPPTAQDGVLPVLWVGVLATCRPRQFSGVHLTLLPELWNLGHFPFPFPFSLTLSLPLPPFPFLSIFLSLFSFPFPPQFRAQFLQERARISHSHCFV